MEQEIYKRTQNLEIKQYDGSIVSAPGVLDSTESLVAVAVARPGRPIFQTRPNSPSNNLSRTLMFGDLAIYSFKKTGEREENGEEIIEGELGTEIMESKPWMIMQTKDPKTGDVREPFVRGPWDVRQTINGSFGALQPPSLSSSVKLLADEAINLAAEELGGKIERGEPVRSQAEYAKAASAATRMANKLIERYSSNTQSTTHEEVSEGAVTEEDLD